MVSGFEHDHADVKRMSNVIILRDGVRIEHAQDHYVYALFGKWNERKNEYTAEVWTRVTLSITKKKNQI